MITTSESPGFAAANRIVWARLGSIWWPAKIVDGDESKLPADVFQLYQNAIEKFGSSVQLVYLFGKCKYSVSKTMCELDENFKKYSKRCKGDPVFQQGLLDCKDSSKWPDDPAVSFCASVCSSAIIIQNGATHANSLNSCPQSDSIGDASPAPQSKSSNLHVHKDDSPGGTEADSFAMMSAYLEGNKQQPDQTSQGQEPSFQMSMMNEVPPPLPLQQLNQSSFNSDLVQFKGPETQQDSQFTENQLESLLLLNDQYSSEMLNDIAMQNEQCHFRSIQKNLLDLKGLENRLQVTGSAFGSVTSTWTNGESFQRVESTDDTLLAGLPYLSQKLDGSNIPLNPESFVPDSSTMSVINNMWMKNSIAVNSAPLNSPFAQQRSFENFEMVCIPPDAPPAPVLEKNGEEEVQKQSVDSNITSAPVTTAVGEEGVQVQQEESIPISEAQIPDECDWKVLISVVYPSFSLGKTSFKARMRIPKGIKYFLEKKNTELKKSLDNRYVVPPEHQDEFVAWFKAYEATDFMTESIKYSVPGQDQEQEVHVTAPLANEAEALHALTQNLCAEQPTASYQHQTSVSAPIAQPTHKQVQQRVSLAPVEEVVKPLKPPKLVVKKPTKLEPAWKPEVDDLVWAKHEGTIWWPAKVEPPLAFPMAPEDTPENVQDYLPLYFFGLHNYAWVKKDEITPFYFNGYDKNFESGVGNDDFQLGVSEAFQKDTWPIRDYTPTPKKGRGKCKGPSKAKSKGRSSLPNYSVSAEDLLEDDIVQVVASASKVTKMKSPAVNRRKSTGSTAPRKKAKSAVKVLEHDDMDVVLMPPDHDGNSSLESVSAESSGDESLKRKVPTTTAMSGSILGSGGKKKIKPVTIASKRAGPNSASHFNSASPKAPSLQFQTSSHATSSSKIPKPTVKSSASSSSSLQPPAVLRLSEISNNNANNTVQEAKSPISAIPAATAEHTERMQQLEYEAAKRKARTEALKEVALARMNLRELGCTDAEINELFPLHRINE